MEDDRPDTNPATKPSRFRALVTRITTDQESLKAAMNDKEAELLRDLFVSYIVNTEKHFSKKKLVEGLVHAAIRNPTIKDKIFSAFDVRNSASQINNSLYG